MKNLRKTVAITSVVLVLAATVSIALVGVLLTSDIDQDSIELSNDEIWFDDWYTVTRIDDQTFAIGEPRYWQKNYNYLIVGQSRALLFDTGPGVRDISKVTRSLTQLPVTVMSSHPHYDHIGNNFRFDRVAWVRVPSIVSEVTDDGFQPTFTRGFTLRTIPPFKISEWLQPEQEIDLGQRRLQIFHVPGHEEGSFALLDADRQQLFTGDFIYPGWLVAFAPTSDLHEYLRSVLYLISHTSGSETIYGAHAVAAHPSPVLPHSALEDLEELLEALNSGAAIPRQRFPMRVFTVNADMDLHLFPFQGP